MEDILIYFCAGGTSEELLLAGGALADHIFGKMTFILSEYLEKI